MSSYFRAGQYALRRLNIERYLNGRTAGGTVELISSANGTYAGTQWEVSVYRRLERNNFVEVFGRE